jgi:hypothetical protein
MKKSCLIITSCIYPFSTFVQLKDPEEREALHTIALRRWLNESSFKKIIICDNSDYKYSNSFIEEALSLNKKLEILSFKGDHKKVYDFGKGYGEGELMKYVFENSKLINECKSFVKVTGKLFIENHYPILSNLKGSNFAFSIPIYFIHSKKVVDLVYTNFYYADIESFKTCLLDAYLGVRDNEGIYLEHIYASSLRNYKKKNKSLKITVMNPIPLISGKSGTTGDLYFPIKSFKSTILNILLKTFIVKKLS